MRCKRAIAFIATLILSPVSGVLAQGYPVKTVRIIVPVAPGGGLDTQARLLSRKFQETLGQTFVVDNRPGAAAMIGTELVVRAAPDGYTLLCAAATLASTPTLNRNLPFDLQRDLVPVTQISSTAQLLVAHPSLPARTLGEFIALLKKQSGKLNAASGGTGSTNHVALEMLKQRAGVNVTHIRYKGSGPATIALMSGEVDFSFAGSITAQPHLRSGKIRLLAVTTLKPAPAFPGAPPLATIFPGFEATNWYAFFAPAATPAAIINRLSAETHSALKTPGVHDFLVREGADAVGSTPPEFAAFFKGEIERYAQVIREAGIKAEP